MIKSQKNRLKPQLTISHIGRLRFFIGIGLDLGHTIVFYAFCVGLRDALRYCFWGSATYIHLTAKEVFTFNAFFAGLACCFGLYQFLSFTLGSLKNELPRKARRNIFDSLQFYPFAFLFASGFAVLDIAMAVASEGKELVSEIITYLPWVWPLILIMLFNQLWNGVKRYYRCHLWYYSSLAIGVIITLLLTNWDLSNHAAIQNYIKAKDQIEHAYIKAELDRVEKWKIKIDDFDKWDFYSLIKHWDFFWEYSNEKSISATKPVPLLSLIRIKCAIKMGYWAHVTCQSEYDISTLTQWVLDEEESLEKQRKTQLIIEILEECKRYYHSKKLSQEAFDQLSTEEKVWLRRVYRFRDWERYAPFQEDTLTKWDYFLHDIKSGYDGESLDLGTLDVDVPIMILCESDGIEKLFTDLPILKKKLKDNSAAIQSVILSD